MLFYPFPVLFDSGLPDANLCLIYVVLIERVVAVAVFGLLILGDGAYSNLVVNLTTWWE